MSQTFDPLYEWLGISPDEHPVSYYRLLGLRPLESDPTVIENAADRQMLFLRQFQGGPRGSHVLPLLTAVAQARVCLLNPESKAAYDQQFTANHVASDSDVSDAQTAESAVGPQLVVTGSARPLRTRGGRKNAVLEFVKIGGGGVAVVLLAVGIWQVLFGGKLGSNDPPPKKTTERKPKDKIARASEPPPQAVSTPPTSPPLATVEASTQAGLATTDAADPPVPPADQYAEAMRGAKQAVLDKYQELIKSLTAEARQQEALAVRDEMKVFADAEIMSGRPAMKEAFLKYCHARKAARDSLAAPYEQALQGRLLAGELDQANELRKKLAEFPAFGPLVSLENTSRRGHFVQHAGYTAWLRTSQDDVGQLNATFELLPGLAASEAVSFRSPNVPGYYLAHADLRLHLVKDDGTDVFRNNATFKKTPGLASASASSFEAINFPDHFICAQGHVLYLKKNDGMPQFQRDATFSVVEPLYKLW